MYKFGKPQISTVSSCPTIEGETIELKIQRIMTNKEPIKDGAPLVYTERAEGVKAAYNIRTDRFEIAAEAMDKVHKSTEAKRDEKANMPKDREPIKKADEKEVGGAESIQASKE